MGQRKSGWERVVGGLIVLVAVGFLWESIHLPVWMVVGIGLVFGLLPTVGGIRRLVGDFAALSREKRQALETRLSREQRARDGLEKTILKIASERGGVVTPALVVLNSDIKLEEAEKALSDMAARGYAEMRVKDNGTFDYVFHDLT